jgi:hypothetical protein
MLVETVQHAVLLARCAVPRDMISYNKSQGQHWAHKTKSTQQKKEWAKWLRSTEGLDIPVLQGANKRMIRICRIVSGRMQLFEPVNLWAGAKPIEDALVDLGWLEDDDAKHCELKVEQFKVQSAADWIQEAVRQCKAKITVEVFDLDAPVL